MKRYLLRVATLCMALSALSLSSCKKEDENEISMDVLSHGVEKILGTDGTEYEVVDLGLTSQTLWAKCNLGATSPEQAGSFFAWGETKTKRTYENFNYAWYDDVNGEKLTKYCSRDDYGFRKFTDKLHSLQPEDDPATQILGKDWYTPTKDDYDELRRWCTFKWCKLNGVSGFLITSTRKGYEENSIFMPLSGKMDFEDIKFEGKYGFYWTNTLNTNEPTDAYIIRLRHDGGVDELEGSVDNERYHGLNVRPVTTK